MPNSAWTTTGSGISLVATQTALDGSSPENVNYLTNADKITLMAQYAGELARRPLWTSWPTRFHRSQPRTTPPLRRSTQR
jgi:hypothetical protein